MDSATIIQNALQTDYKVSVVTKKAVLDSYEVIKSKLKFQQVECFQRYVSSLNSVNQVFMINGAAGTGKTFLTAKCIEEYARLYPHANISVCAPTNKAVSVISQKVDFTSGNISFCTVHSKLSLSKKVDVSGNELFEISEYSKQRWSKTDLFVIDEVSMIDSTMENYLRTYAERFPTCKFLLVGDFAQVPPVGNEDSAFNNPNILQNWTVERYELNTPIRQGEGNPIIDLAYTVRNNLRNVIVPYSYQNISSVNGGIALIPRENNHLIAKTLNDFFTSRQFKENSNFCKVLAWRNKTLDGINAAIRRFVFPDTFHIRICLNEVLVFNKPYMVSEDGVKTVLFNTNEEVRILDFRVKTLPVELQIAENPEIRSYKMYECQVERVNKSVNKDKSEKFVNNYSDSDIEIINIIHEDSDVQYQLDLQSMQRRIKGIRGNPNLTKLLWKKFFEFQEHFANISYSYAISIHKAQGSTYQNAIISEADIKANHNIYERNRILYTAYTRPSDNLILIR